MNVAAIPSRDAAALVVEHHYLHRRPSISSAFALIDGDKTVGVVTYGVPPSRHAQMSVCPSDPNMALELNRLWCCDSMPTNTESWFVSRSLRLLPPRLVFSYADTAWGHDGTVYRALNFHYAGWTDMERKTPRFDYIPLKAGAHTREVFRSGYGAKVRRKPKVKYWIATGNRSDQRRLTALCGWPRLDWKKQPAPKL